VAVTACDAVGVFEAPPFTQMELWRSSAKRPQTPASSSFPSAENAAN